MDRRAWRHFDYPLLLLAITLTVYGWFMIRSAQPPDRPYATYQLIWIGVGLVAFFAFSFVDYRLFQYLAHYLYAALVLGLGLVLIAGHVAFGSQRWFAVLFFTVQPSELAKIGLIITLAAYFARRPVTLKTVLVSAILTAIPAALIYLQPSLSAALTLFVIWAGVLFVAGLPLRYFVGTGVLAAAAAPLVWHSLLQEYMRERIRIFLNPLADPSGSGYNLLQSRIAIGSGGLLGQGYGAGGQSQLGYLRVRHTDFIFSVIAEELGFVGALVLILLLALLLLRLLHIAQTARDTHGHLLVTGVATMIFFQAFVNMGVNVGILPPTGVSLPFISYGGSSLIALFVSLGLVESVALRRQRLEFG